MNTNRNSLILIMSEHEAILLNMELKQIIAKSAQTHISVNNIIDLQIQISDYLIHNDD